MGPDQMPTPKSSYPQGKNTSMKTELSDLIKDNIKSFEINKLKRRGLRPFEIKYLKAFDAIAIKRFSEDCSI